MIVLTGLKPVVTYTTALQEKMKESIHQLVEEFTNNLILLQNQQDSLNRVQITTICSIIDQIKQLGRDELLFSKLITGLSNYFKETNWMVDAVLSKIKTTNLIEELSASFGIANIERYSVTYCSNSVLKMMDEMRESLHIPISLNDLSHTLFLFFTLQSVQTNLCELLHGYRMVCYLMSPEEAIFSRFLQGLFKCFTLVWLCNLIWL